MFLAPILTQPTPKRFRRNVQSAGWCSYMNRILMNLSKPPFVPSIQSLRGIQLNHHLANFEFLDIPSTKKSFMRGSYLGFLMLEAPVPNRKILHTIFALENWIPERTSRHLGEGMKRTLKTHPLFLGGVFWGFPGWRSLKMMFKG